MNNFRYPSPAELYALEQWAHRERSKALARLLVAGARAVKSFLVRGLAFAQRGSSAHALRKQAVRHA